MEVIVKKQVMVCNGFSKLLKVKKMINPELCVDTDVIARKSPLGKNEAIDCVVRAFMACLDVSYEMAHSFCKTHLNRKDRQGTYTCMYVDQIIGRVKNGKKITGYGYSPKNEFMSERLKCKTVLKNPKYKKPTGFTLASFLENHPTGRYFVIVEGHAVAVVEGKLYGNSREGEYRINRRVHYVLKISNK